MANVFTDLASDVYKAADIIGREIHGIIPSVTINAGSEAAAKGDTVRSFQTRKATVTDNDPSMTIPEGTDQTVDNKTLVLNRRAEVLIPWTGEDMKSMDSSFGWETIYGDQIVQAMRAISNQIETDLAVGIKNNSSRVVGVEGTPLFGTNHNIINEARQVLVDNGAPVNDGNVSLVMNTLAGTNLRNLSNLHKVNEAGDSTLLRQGVLQDISLVSLRESFAIAQQAAPAATGYLVNEAGGHLVDSESINVDTGSGLFLAGDIATIAGQRYVINADQTGSVLTLAEPGLRAAAADDSVITEGSAYAANVMFHRAAVELAIRPEAMPAGGDAATDEMIVQDPHSGLVFRLAFYKGFKKAMFAVSTLYDYKVWNPDFVVTAAG